MGVGSGKRGAAPTRRDPTRRGGVSRSSSRRRRRPSRRVLSGAPCASREPSASHAKRVNLFTREADRRTRGACTFVRGRFSLIDSVRAVKALFHGGATTPRSSARLHLLTRSFFFFQNEGLITTICV